MAFIAARGEGVRGPLFESYIFLPAYYPGFLITMILDKPPRQKDNRPGVIVLHPTDF
jgi:hypothetical protein